MATAHSPAETPTLPLREGTPMELATPQHLQQHPPPPREAGSTQGGSDHPHPTPGAPGRPHLKARPQGLEQSPQHPGQRQRAGQEQRLGAPAGGEVRSERPTPGSPRPEAGRGAGRGGTEPRCSGGGRGRVLLSRPGQLRPPAGPAPPAVPRNVPGRGRRGRGAAATRRQSTGLEPRGAGLRRVGDPRGTCGVFREEPGSP